jgi:hypothetical protein
MRTKLSSDRTNYGLQNLNTTGKNADMNLSQMELVSAIFAELDRQCPGASMPPSRVLNLICRSATEIVREAEIEFKPATPGMGLLAWLSSDDTGLSSLFMAHILYDAPKADANFPRDNDDLGRCERLLSACGHPTEEKWAELSMFEGWNKPIELLRHSKK